jgi:hypothetical protein
VNRYLTSILIFALVGLTGCDKVFSPKAEKIAISCIGNQSVHIRLNDKPINHWSSPTSRFYVFEKLSGKNKKGNAIR